jgi:hypothetical protein
MANGIPSLLGQIANVTNTLSLVYADAGNILGMFAGPQWGVFNPDGSPALQPDSMVSLEAKQEWRIPNYPVEQGAFETYNKVLLPQTIRLRMTKGGTTAARNLFLSQVEGAAAELILFKIIMPEGPVTSSANIQSYSYSRTSTNGVGLLTVDVEFIEVMANATAAFSNTAQPDGQDPTNTGTVQPQTPTGSLASLFGPDAVPNFQ